MTGHDSTNSVYSGASPEKVAADLATLVDFQAAGLSHAELEALISDSLLPHLMRYDRPGFQSMFNAIPSAEARLGAKIALEFNQGVTNWQVSPGGAMLEVLCCEALCRLFELGDEAGATFMYAGTYGNQQALYLALHRHAERQGFDFGQQGIGGFDDPGRLAILASESGHFSLKHAVRTLGLGEQSVVLVPVDDRQRMSVTTLRNIAKEMRPAREIVCIVATAGSTSTGAVDPIDEIADLCADMDTWLHVDGAYGYAYKLVPGWSHLFAGDTRADSLIWDPHKQLGAPIPNSVLFLKRRSDFARMALHSHYFNRPDADEPNPGLKSPPSTRPMSALSLVTLLRGQGLAQVVSGLEAPLLAIRDLARYIDELPDVERLHQPDTGILCFRVTAEGVGEGALDELQRNLYRQVLAKGERSVSITELNGKSALRVVVVTPEASFEALRDTVDELRRLARARGREV